MKIRMNLNLENGRFYSEEEIKEKLFEAFCEAIASEAIEVARIEKRDDIKEEGITFFFENNDSLYTDYMETPASEAGKKMAESLKGGYAGGDPIKWDFIQVENQIFFLE